MTSREAGSATRGASRSPVLDGLPARVIVLDSAARPIRAREREFRDAGLVLVRRSDAAAALVELGHARASAVLAPTDMTGMSVVDFTDVVVSLASAPVVVGLGGEGDESLAVAALDAGARAIVPLPFSPARVALELRGLRAPAALVEGDDVRCGHVHLSPAEHRVRVDGLEVHLSPKEFAILEYLMRRSPRVVRVDELVHAFEGGDARHVGRLRVTIAKIRSRLAEASPTLPEVLSTIRGIGYRVAD